MYNDFNDYELIAKFHEGYEEAKEILYNKYLYIIETEIKKYSKAAYILGYDQTDLFQEALVGFSNALANFREDKDASLSSFITLCVDRKVNSSIKKASRQKNKLVNNSLSLEESYGCCNTPLMNIISDKNENNPLENIVREENITKMEEKIKTLLSEKEYEVFLLLQKGLKYDKIAEVLKINTKKVDNTIQRIKSKIKIYLEISV